MDKSNTKNEPSFLAPVRIWLCGAFRLQCGEGTTESRELSAETLPHRKDVSQALSLLKLLLCQPERQAHRDWIMEQFWPESAQSTATHRLENVASTFRQIFHPWEHEPLLRSINSTRKSGILYRLPAYPHLWVDVDAIQWNIEQAARMERFGDDSFPYWQRAFDLLKRGPFLADEPYAEWAKEPRERFDGFARQCVHALPQLSIERHGAAAKAEALLLLRVYWQQHKTDEDVLRPLLELLGEQERYQEAEEYYQQLLLALAEEGSDKDGRSCEPDARTRDIREYLCAKQVQRTIPSPAIKENGQGLWRRIPPQDVNSINSIKAVGNEAFPSVALRGISPEEFLAQCNAALAGCWHLLQHKGFVATEQILSANLPALYQLTMNISEYQDTAASLVIQAKILQAILATHKLDYPRREIACLEAIRFSQFTKDRRLQAVSLMYQAYTYTYCYPLIPDKAIMLFTQALQCLDRDAFLLRSDIGIGLADAYAQANREKEALNVMEIAQDVFPAYPEQDQSYIYADCTQAEMYQWQGRMQIHLADNGRDPHYYQQAYDAFSIAARLQSIGDRSTAHSLILKADAARGMGDLEHYAESLERGVRIALQIDSKKRYHDAFTVFQKAPETWLKEAKWKELQEIFQPGRS